VSEPVREIVVRPARASELGRAGKISVAAYQADGWIPPGHSYTDRLADAARRAREAELLVAVDSDGHVLGTVTVCLPGTPWSEISRPGELEFRMLAVDPPARGRGVGGALVAAVVRRAHELGASRVVLSSLAEMRAAHRIYRRLGFARMPERDWAPEERMALQAYALDLEVGVAVASG
jgi:ribosomal protein S18 acetylase RimI-like enzyme